MVSDLGDDLVNPTLRKALTQLADSPDVANTITFQAALTGTINLGSSLPTITKNVVMTNADGPLDITVRRDPLAPGTFEIFRCTAQDVTISGLTISGGNIGGIGAHGTRLELQNCRVSGNEGTKGGGILVDPLIGVPVLVLRGTTVSGNTAKKNAAGGDGNGGGIHNRGGFVWILDESYIISNTAENDGGGIYNARFINDARLSVQRSTVSGNNSVRNGGGIWNDSAGNGFVGIWASTIKSNFTEPLGTGVGGGLYNKGKASVEISTISGNEATAGGGIYAVAQSTTEVRMSTFAMNEAQVFGGGIFVEQNASLTIFLTIVADNTTGFVGPDVIGNVTSHGFNYIGDGSGSSGWLVFPFDFVGTPEAPRNPLLGPLGFYGGPTETHILLPGSEARDAGNNDLVTSDTDQRGFEREVGIVDIGAVEMQEWEEEIGDQWASSVLDFSSEYSPTDWSAAQTLGEPDTFEYGDMPTAWAASTDNGTLEFITLGFTTPVYATGVTIRETWGNGFVYQVDLLDENDVPHTIWYGTDPSQPGTPVDFVITFPATTYLVKAVKTYTNTDHDQGAWEEIDAVMLHGSGSGGAALGSGSAPLSTSTATRAFSVRRPGSGPSATFSASGPARVGVPVTFRFTNPTYRSGGTSATGFRYSFDFNNDRDFTDPGELSGVASSLASFTFTRRGWHVAHGRIIAPDGRFTDFWTRVFVV